VAIELSIISGSIAPSFSWWGTEILKQNQALALNHFVFGLSHILNTKFHHPLSEDSGY